MADKTVKKKQAKKTDEPEILQIPCTIYKVSTGPVGGHRITFDTPDIAAESVKQLIGLENKQNFIMCLIKTDEKEQEKCKQPLKKHLIFKK